MEEIILNWIATELSEHSGLLMSVAPFVLLLWQRVKAHLTKIKKSVDKQIEAFEAYRTAQLDHESEMIELLKDIKSNTRK